MSTIHNNTETQVLRHNGRIVGVIYDGSRLVKKVKSKHQLIRPPAWAIQSSILDYAKQKGVQTVEIINTDNERVYTAPMSLIYLKGGELNRGYGNQNYLPLEFWQTSKAGQPAQLSIFSVSG